MKPKRKSSQSEPDPTTAFTLSLTGGIFVLLAGLLVAAVGPAFTFFIGGIGGFVGVLGIMWGIITIVSAYNLRSNPQQHMIWGIIILVFSIVSWTGALGGFFIGFMLALIGGILALVWSPHDHQERAPLQLSLTRFGTAAAADEVFLSTQEIARIVAEKSSKDAIFGNLVDITFSQATRRSRGMGRNTWTIYII